MPSVNFLYKKSYAVTDDIKIAIPTVREIIECEDEYYGSVFSLTAMPIDLMVQLDDIGIDFTKINDYELFLLMFSAVRESECAGLIFDGLNLQNFQTVMDENERVILFDQETGIKIDRAAYQKIAWVLREIHGLKRNTSTPGNDEARKYMLERERIKMKRAARRKQKSYLESLIIALVNTEQFKYDYASVLDLTIYQLNASVRQIAKKISYDNLMIGCYTGNVDMKKLSQDELLWLPN